MMPAEYISRRRSSSKTPPPGMTSSLICTPKWVKIDNYREERRGSAKMVKKEMNQILTSLKQSAKSFRKKKKKSSTSLSQLKTEKSNRAIATIVSPMLGVVPLLNRIQSFTEQESSKHKTVVVRIVKIGGEDALVNEVLIQSHNELGVLEKDKTVTPENYRMTIDYFRNINHARQNYFTAAMKLGEMLERGWLKGDAEGWVEYMNWAREEERKWKERCRYSHERREKDKRNVYDDDDEGLCWRMRRLYSFSKSRVIWAVRYVCSCCEFGRQTGETCEDDREAKSIQ